MYGTGIARLGAGLAGAALALAGVTAASPATTAASRSHPADAPRAVAATDAPAPQAPAADSPSPEAPAPQAPAAAAPSTGASNGAIDIDVEPGPGIWAKPTGGWESRTSFSFAVTITDTGDANQQPLSVFVSVPDQAQIRQTSGDRWTCANVDGGARCTNPDLVIPDEAWPTLTIQGWVLSDSRDDTLDIYADSPGAPQAHWGTPWTLDTSV
jgi:hypothetical protein